MAPTETERFELREGLLDVLEEGPVTTLMDSLPPMDWHELATKTDLAALEERIDVRFERMDAKFEVVDVRIEALRTELGAKIDKGLVDMDTRFERLDTRFEAVDARFTEMRGEMKSGLAKQTFAVLAGVAALAAPFYVALFIALFSGGAG